jgi:hypothetical protein
VDFPFHAWPKACLTLIPIEPRSSLAEKSLQNLPGVVVCEQTMLPGVEEWRKRQSAVVGL